MTAGACGCGGAGPDAAVTLDRVDAILAALEDGRGVAAITALRWRVCARPARPRCCSSWAGWRAG
jgi:hypothetical protein